MKSEKSQSCSESQSLFNPSLQLFSHFDSTSGRTSPIHEVHVPSAWHVSVPPIQIPTPSVPAGPV